MNEVIFKTRICKIKRPEDFSKKKWLNFMKILVTKRDGYCDMIRRDGDYAEIFTRIDKPIKSKMFDFFEDFCLVMNWDIFENMTFEEIDWFKMSDRDYFGKFGVCPLIGVKNERL